MRISSHALLICASFRSVTQSRTSERHSVGVEHLESSRVDVFSELVLHDSSPLVETLCPPIDVVVLLRACVHTNTHITRERRIAPVQAWPARTGDDSIRLPVLPSTLVLRRYRRNLRVQCRQLCNQAAHAIGQVQARAYSSKQSRLQPPLASLEPSIFFRSSPGS
jgi:hypothetical protein